MLARGIRDGFYLALSIALIVLAVLITAGKAHACQASWYGSESGTHTATGERFNPEGRTAAHPYLPLNSWVRVTVTRTGVSAMIRVNDRGPASWTHRCIDLAHGSARLLGVTGTADVTVEPLGASASFSIAQGPAIRDQHHYRPHRRHHARRFHHRYGRRHRR